ncbi:FAD-dependent oxidoreductase [Mesorhizobium sp. KR2-14]|uniref:FAD-dependent oxidoreductase n=1 Tax=Mesorhizobium sp. KR2-14 TaxID=3156610 RepID=UPI0032B59B7C
MVITRRNLINIAGVAALAAPFVARARHAHAAGRIAVVGGGFGGATTARFLAQAGHAVTLVERENLFVTCPFSNTVIGGFATINDISFGYDSLGAAGVTVVQGEAARAEDGKLTLNSGDVISYDRLVLSPGIDMRYDALPGYDLAASQIMPHAWKAGAQTELLWAQLEAMEDGGVVAIVAPDNPFRCPPGPYERASLIAHYLTQHKPRSKVMILDSKDAFSKRPLFEEAWAALYPDMIEWVPMSMGGRVISVNAQDKALKTDFTTINADVANIIPPQKAGAIAAAAGVADATGWCPVNPETFESTLVPGIHVLGDACLAGAMPKSAFSANAQGKVAAAAIDRILRGETPQSPKLINTCYSLAAPDYGFTVAGVYQPEGETLAEVADSGGTSPLGAPRETRVAEAAYARNWYATITREVFG